MIKARLQRSYIRDGYDLWLMSYDLGSTIAKIASPVNLEFNRDSEEGETFPSPTMFLTHDELKALCYEIVESGCLPEDLNRNQRELSAIKGHLEDLKKIAFHALKVPK